MVAQLTLSVSGTTDELAPLLRCMADAMESEADGAKLTSGALSPTDGPSRWWEDHADEFVRQIQPNARLALGIITRHAPEVSFDKVQADMGFELGLSKPLGGIPLSGMLASVGFAKRRMKAPEPFTRDYGRRVYLIDPAIANLLKSSLEKHQP